MKHSIFAALVTLVMGFAVLVSPSAKASEAGLAWDVAPARQNDMASLQNGAKLFVNYCLNCHSAAYLRFNRLKDIGLTDTQIKQNLLFTSEKVGETMKAAIDPRQAKEWFGVNPPDLTLMTRSRSGAHGTGADYLYTYLRSYYRDDTKPTGWNNLAYPNVAMPNVLWELQGERRPVFEEQGEGGHRVSVFKRWEQVTPGSMTPMQFDHAVADLVGFMQWMGEPGRGTRTRLGVWVLFFLLGFTFLAWRLNSVFWRDIK